MTMITELPMAYDPSQYGLPTIGAFIKISGTYKTSIVGAELKAAKNNPQNMYVQFTHEIVEGALKGQRFVDRLNIYNTSSQTVEIAHRQLKAYCVALGIVSAVQDLTVFMNGKNLQARVEAVEELDKNDANKTSWSNNIRELYFADGSELSSGGFSAPASGQPTYATPAPQVSAPAPQPQAPVAPAPQVQAPVAPQAPQAQAPVTPVPQAQAPFAPQASVAPVAPAPVPPTYQQ